MLTVGKKLICKANLWHTVGAQFRFSSFATNFVRFAQVDLFSSYEYYLLGHVDPVCARTEFFGEDYTSSL